MKNRTAIIHEKRLDKIHELIPVDYSDSDLNWIVDWILSLGIGTIHSALHKHPKLTVHDLFVMTTKLPDDIPH